MLKSNFFVSFKSNDLGVSFTMNKVTNNTFVEFSKQNMRLLKPSVFVLVVILLGLQLPEYSLQYIQSGTKRTPQWFSLFGQGASVWLQIVLLTELILICLSYFKKSDGVAFEHADPFNRYIIWVTLAVTLLISWNTWEGLGPFVQNNDQPNWIRSFSAAVTLTAGASIFILLGKVIESYKRGFGFWLILFVIYVVTLPSNLYGRVVLPILHETDPKVGVLLIVSIVLIFSLTVFLESLRRSSQKTDVRSFLFLWMLAEAAAWWIIDIFVLAYALANRMHLIDDRLGQPWLMSHLLISTGVFRIIFISALGYLFYLKNESILIRTIYIAIMIVWALLLLILEEYFLTLPFLYGFGPLLFAWIALEIRDSWAEFNSREKLVALLRHKKPL